MPFWWGVALFFFLLAALALLVALFKRTAETAGAVVVFAFVGVLFTVASSWNTVPVRNVGIVTSFNKPTGQTTGSGSVWVAPWKKVRDWDASVQTEDSTGGGFTGDGTCTGSTLVRIGSLATACVENKIRWQVVDLNAPKQYNDYKGDFNAFRANYFDTERQRALNEVFASYNPLQSINAKTGVVTFDLSAKEGELLTALNKRVCPGGLNDEGAPVTPATCQVRVESISIPLIHHDAKTEQLIKQQQDLLAQGRNLDLQKTNTDKQNAITNSKATTDAVTRCLDNNQALGLSGGPCLQPGYANLAVPAGK